MRYTIHILKMFFTLSFDDHGCLLDDVITLDDVQVIAFPWCFYSFLISISRYFFQTKMAAAEVHAPHDGSSWQNSNANADQADEQGRLRASSTDSVDRELDWLMRNQTKSNETQQVYIINVYIII